MFMKALDAMGKLDDPMFGTIAPDETVNIVFNLSSGQDYRGPWNAGEMHDGTPIEYVAHPEPRGEFPPAPVNSADEQTDAPLGEQVADAPRARTPRSN